MLRREHLPKKVLLPRISPGPPWKNVGVDKTGERRVLSCCLVRPHRDGAVDSGDGDENGEGSYDWETCMMSHQRGPRSAYGLVPVRVGVRPQGHRISMLKARKPRTQMFRTQPGTRPGAARFRNRSSFVVPRKQYVTSDGDHPTICGVFWAPPCSPDSRWLPCPLTRGGVQDERV